VSQFMSDTRTTTRPVPPLSPADRAAYEAWLDQIVDLPEAAKLRGDVHVDTLKRSPETRDKILHLSARRRGMRRRHALMLD
jgi:hypothetical protein